MKYRWKLLILLLCISILPIVGARVFGVNAVRKMGGELVSRSQKRIVDDTRDRLRLLVDTYAMTLWQVREHIETALMIQAAEVERALAADTVRPEGVYFSRDFNRGDRLPADTISSSIHFKSTEEGGMELLKISLDAQVFHLAPGIRKEGVAADIGRLDTLTPLYRRLYKRLEGTVSWQYTVLENGLHSAYPGHNGIPGRLDFRKSPWYRKTGTYAVPWTDPYVDPETRQVVVAASMPVAYSDGTTAGATAMVVPIGQILNQRLLLQNIPEGSRTYLCYIADRPETGVRGARIFAREDHAGFKRRGWRADPGTQWLTSGDAPQFQAMLDDVVAGTGNIRKMAYNDCTCFWAYGPIQGAAFLVAIVPESVILDPIIASKGYVQERIDNLIRMTGFGMSGLVVMIVLVALAFSLTVTRPLQTLVEGAMRLAEGRFDVRVDIRSQDEFGEMGRVFNFVVPRLEEYYRMSRSMALGREVQQNLLPKGKPSSEGLDIAGTSISCDETGGDYYDFLESRRRGPERIGLVVGDVSDHGLPAALLMASARAYLRQRVSMPGRIADIVGDVNRQLVRDVEESGRFMTLFYGEIDSRERVIRWVRAGHDPGLFYDPVSDSFQSLAGRGVPLGVDQGAVFEESEQAVRPGQIIVIGTDGIWEAFNPSGEMFGKERLRRVVRTNAGASSKRILDAVISAVGEFRQTAKTEDDMTLVVVKVTDDGQRAKGAGHSVVS